jgi:hypothetical protein
VHTTRFCVDVRENLVDQDIICWRKAELTVASNRSSVSRPYDMASECPESGRACVRRGP